MPNKRRDGWRVSTYSAPAKLIEEAQAKAKEAGTDVSAVIREALERYVKRK